MIGVPRITGAVTSKDVDGNKTGGDDRRDKQDHHFGDHCAWNGGHRKEFPGATLELFHEQPTPTMNSAAPRPRAYHVHPRR